MENPLPAAEDIRRTAQDVLQRSHYELSQFDPTSTPILMRIVRWIAGLFRGLYSFFERLYSITPFGAWALVIALFVILGLLIWHMVYSLKQALRVQGHADGGGETEVDAGIIPEEWEKRARACAKTGDYIGAVRALFLASICTLEAAQNKTIRRGATNREYLRRFKNTPAFEPLSLFVNIIDTKWYSGGSCSADDYTQSEAAFVQVRRAAGSLHADRA